MSGSPQHASWVPSLPNNAQALRIKRGYTSNSGLTLTNAAGQEADCAVYRFYTDQDLYFRVAPLADGYADNTDTILFANQPEYFRFNRDDEFSISVVAVENPHVSIWEMD